MKSMKEQLENLLKNSELDPSLVEKLKISAELAEKIKVEKMARKARQKERAEKAFPFEDAGALKLFDEMNKRSVGKKKPSHKFSPNSALRVGKLTFNTIKQGEKKPEAPGIFSPPKCDAEKRFQEAILVAKAKIKIAIFNGDIEEPVIYKKFITRNKYTVENDKLGMLILIYQKCLEIIEEEFVPRLKKELKIKKDLHKVLYQKAKFSIEKGIVE